MKLRKALGVAGGLLSFYIVWILVSFFSPDGQASLNRALAEEKSYFKHAGTYYQLRRELRGQKGNLETWDEAEQIVGVVNTKGPKGVWAAWSNELDYLPQSLQLDPRKLPMCVIRLNENVYVVRGVKRRVARCEAIQPGFGVSNVMSGELAPSSDGVAEIYYQQVE